MKILNLTQNSNTYTANAYLVTGTWNTLKDRNTLVDVGRDPGIIEIIRTASTGVGKPPVEQVMLTHSHYDHAGMLPRIREIFRSKVYAFSRSLSGVDHFLKDTETIKMGDRVFDVFYTPGHSSDSACFYCQEEGVLFSGDTPLFVQSNTGSHESAYVHALERLCRKDIRAIYPGHGPPLLEGCNRRLRASLKWVRESHHDKKRF